MNKLENPLQDDVAGPAPRHKTTQVMVGNVAVGGGAPIVVQSLTNTDTADVEGTVKQIAALAGLMAAALYTPLTGSEVPMLRSLAMAALVVLGILAGRRAISRVAGAHTLRQAP